MSEITSSTKTYGDSLRDGWLAPLLQALTTGILTGLALAVLCWALGVEWANTKRVVFSAIPIVLLLAWLFSLRGWRNRLETMLGMDLDKNGVIGAPPPQVVSYAPLEITVWEEDKDGIPRAGQKVSFERPNFLKVMAQAWQKNIPLTQNEICSNHKLMERDDFNTIRDQLLSSGCAVYRNGRNLENGWKLTERGERVFEAHAGAREIIATIPSPIQPGTTAKGKNSR